MSNFKKILVAVDLSECSKPALQRAASLAARCGAELDVLHVWEAPQFMPPESIMIESALGGRTLVDLVEKRAGGELDAFVAEARGRGIAIGRALCERGVPSAVIVQAAERGNYDLIALGTHGRTGISHAVLGSVAERVVRHASCPVLSVRGDSPARDPGIRRILVPVDYSEHSRTALELAVGVARTMDASLDVVHVWDRPSYVAEDVLVHTSPGSIRPLAELIRENAEREMADFLAEARRGMGDGLPQLPSNRLLSGEPASTLLGELGKGTHELVVIGTKGHTGLKHLLLGSVAEKLVRLSPVPVLTVPRVSAR